MTDTTLIQIMNMMQVIKDDIEILKAEIPKNAAAREKQDETEEIILDMNGKLHKMVMGLNASSRTNSNKTNPISVSSFPPSIKLWIKEIFDNDHQKILNDFNLNIEEKLLEINESTMTDRKKKIKSWNLTWESIDKDTDIFVEYANRYAEAKSNSFQN